MTKITDWQWQLKGVSLTRDNCNVSHFSSLSLRASDRLVGHPQTDILGNLCCYTAGIFTCSLTKVSEIDLARRTAITYIAKRPPFLALISAQIICKWIIISRVPIFDHLVDKKKTLEQLIFSTSTQSLRAKNRQKKSHLIAGNPSEILQNFLERH